MKKLPLLIVLLFLTSGCTAGYRYASYDTTVASPSGDADLVANEKVTQIGTTVDFRYLRLSFIGEIGSFEGFLYDERGRRAKLDEKQTSTWYGIEVPLLTIWDIGSGGCCAYPPAIERRHTVEIWVSGSIEPERPTFMADASVVYYFTRFVGVELFAGLSSIEFSGTTNDIDGTLRFDELVGWGPTMGLTVVFPAGPWGAAILEEIIAWDEWHRDEHGGY